MQVRAGGNGMSITLWKIALSEAFKRYGRKIAVRYWRWRVELAKKREEKKHEEAIDFSNSGK